MKYNTDIHHRHSIRLKNYNYSKQGIYFYCNVGAGLVSAPENKNTIIGEMVKETYLNLEKEFTHIKLHEYIIMPNHIHGIIEICARADTRPAPTLSEIVCSFKSRTTLMCIKGVEEEKYKPFNRRIWQRNYYEHIIRNEKEYLQIQEYIRNNPKNWENDKFNC